ncbi:MAG TPA: HDIG domain-containing protein [Bacteroidales bacterium]
MRINWSGMSNHYYTVNRIFLFTAVLVILVSLFPREGKFKYEFQKGSPWLHEDLIAPFDFAILKPAAELEKERTTVLNDLHPYFRIDDVVPAAKFKALSDMFDSAWVKSPDYRNAGEQLRLKYRDITFALFDSVFNKGIIVLIPEIENKPPDFEITVVHGNEAETVELQSLFTISSADEYVRTRLQKVLGINPGFIIPLLENAIAQNIFFDAATTRSERDEALANISTTKGMVQKGERIISRGELVSSEKFQKIESLKNDYELQLGLSSKYYLILLGQVILIAISLLVFILFMVAFRHDIYAENKNIVLILLLITIMVFITSMIIDIDVSYLYIVPLCLVPIIIRTFYDTRLALFVHIITIIIIGFLVPNSFQFLFLQLITGIITIITIVNLQRRAQFFFTSLMIFITYSVIYIGMTLIQEGSFSSIDERTFILFGGSALLTLFSYPLIFVFEKIFGLVTDVSLMELSDTNSKLLREMARNAPGTFQHSLQVANLAEEAAHAIGANTLLTRTGALYHDIGKMEMAQYFIENQSTGINPHDELTYEESAKVIIGHVQSGIEKARLFKLPELIIDFIRTHHGTRYTGYFYQMQIRNYPGDDFNKASFRYNGPIPFSKETSILMMADSVEAASRSLKQYDETSIHTLVETIIDKQIETNQFLNSELTLKDITRIKKILKKLLMNIYHIRVEYPVGK